MPVSYHRPAPALGHRVAIGPWRQTRSGHTPELAIDRSSPERQTHAKQLLLFCTLLLSTFAIGAAAQDKLYKYTDENGRTVYSQQPPAGKRSAKQLDLIGVQPPKDTSTTQQLERRLDEVEEERKDREFKAQMQQQEEQREAVLKKNCETARENLRLLRDAPRLKTTDKDGQEVFVADSERATRMEAAQQQIQDYCK